MARELTYFDAERRNNKRRKRRRREPGHAFGGYVPKERVVQRRRFSAIDWAVMLVSVAVAVGMAASWAARWIRPEIYGFMSAAGLLVPVFFALNFLCLLYWVIRWRKGVWLPLLIFVCGVWSVTLFFRPALTQDYGAAGADRSLVTVMTYNVRGMMRPALGSDERLRSSMRDVVAVIDSLRPDIVCIQEFQSTAANPSSRFDEALPVYNYKRIRFNIASTAENHGWGNAIYSKFPIADSGFLDFDGTNNSVLWADVAVGRDTLRVYCAHLQTTSIKADDERYIEAGDFVADDGAKLRQIVGRLGQNYLLRASQAEVLAASVALSAHRVVVCGDFNDTPASWAYRVVSRGLRDSFREAGTGYGYTYRGFFNLLRIDYVLHSRGLQVVDYASPSFDNSDHNPVAVRMRVH